jgi:hypothetical protein
MVSLMLEPRRKSFHTVKLVSCGPDVDKGRCPNLGFFLSFCTEDMIAIVRGTNGRCERRTGRCRNLRGIRPRFENLFIRASSSHELIVIPVRRVAAAESHTTRPPVAA